MRQEAKEYPSFPLGNRLYIRLCLYSRGKTFHTPSEEKEDFSACILFPSKQRRSSPSPLSATAFQKPSRLGS